MNGIVRTATQSLMLGLVLSVAAPVCQGVILYWSADRATWAPSSCVYGNSGWQYEGMWGNFLGTPIAPNYFVTAKHVGGSIGDSFTYNGQVYTTTASYPSPTSDLQIWKVSSAFGSYAPLYTLNNEVGKTMTIYGRGTTRGSAVTVNGVTKGWTWGTWDHAESWGSNKVDQIANGGAGVGQMLAFKFDATGDYYEGSLSLGDSGGAVFIKDGSTWKLAGINYGTDGYYSYTGQSGTAFSASVFDMGGLYVGSDASGWSYVSDQTADIPGASYATRISANQTWIHSIIGYPVPAVPEPITLALLLGAPALLFRRRGC
jgi:hypothetical protein